VKDPRPLKSLENKLKAKEASLQRGMEELVSFCFYRQEHADLWLLLRQGQTLEEIIQDLARAKLACDKAQDEFRDMTALVNVRHKCAVILGGPSEHYP
jgi:hypothetical protein